MRALLLLSIVALATASLQLKNDWEAWKRAHGKAYADDLEESLRHAIWFQNYHYVKDHNNRESFILSLNAFADLVGLQDQCFGCFHEGLDNPLLSISQTREQFIQKYLNPVDVESHLQAATEVFTGHNVSCPTNLDWRSMGFVTDVCYCILNTAIKIVFQLTIAYSSGTSIMRILYLCFFATLNRSRTRVAANRLGHSVPLELWRDNFTRLQDSLSP